MKYISLFLFTAVFFGSCTTKNQIKYLNDIKKKEANSWLNLANPNEKIEEGDILKIDVITVIAEASTPYNKQKFDYTQTNIEILKLNGYLVDSQMTINFPVLGKINVENLNEKGLEEKIKKLLNDGNHLTNPIINVRRINNKFTVLGEVNNPGTFSYFDKNINILQALGYAGDLTIDGNRKDITLVREINGKRQAYNIGLTKSEFLESPLYNIKNNDIIIINPSFSKIKSAGFIGSPASIASIAQILLSITLLIINN